MISAEINGIKLRFETAASSFSPRFIDRGTLAMLSAADLTGGSRLLDLGCGYGVAGIYAAKLIGAQNVIMSDVDGVSVELSKKNAAINGVGDIKVILSDGFTGITESGFTHILSNPPYQADFAVPKRFIEKGFNRLQLGGKLIMVTRRKLWYKNKLIAIFGGVKIVETDGYYVFIAEKRGSQYAKSLK